MVPRILVTAGEPAGVGPDLIAMIAQNEFPAELAVVGDPDLLLSRAKQLHLPLQLRECKLDDTPEKNPPGILKVIPIKLPAPAVPGELNPKNATYVLQTLKESAHLCMKNLAQAVVTTPVHKATINQSGFSFSGHTEFFASVCNVAHTVMLFVTADNMKVALLTTHIPLGSVSQHVTKERLRSTLEVIQQSFKQLFSIDKPRMLVCGLNPHAGEGGYLGREEIETITPLLESMRQKGYQLAGPLPADTIFTPKYLKQADVILAMYHDQALPVVKYAGFGHAVNVTLGLPFIRTSVDHGTALDIAGTTQIDAGSMLSAMQLALSMVQHHHGQAIHRN